MIVVSDTSALSNLVLVDHLGLLKAIYHKVIIPDVVASELVAASNPTISAILQLDWIQPQFLNNFQLANQLQQERGLDFTVIPKRSHHYYVIICYDLKSQ